MQPESAYFHAGVEVDGEVLPADVVVIAMGPWSKKAAEWLPLPPVSGQKAHSVIVQPSSPVTSHCLFTQISGTKSKGPWDLSCFSFP